MTAFGVLTAPAALLGRIRYDLRASIGADEQTFAGGPARWFLLVLAGVAVGYPILASIFHVTLPNTIVGPPYELAIRPVFEVVYSESLPFMLAVLAVGTWSPALGVLFMAVFIPADLVAAGQSSPELVHLGWQQYPEPIFARFISYGLLWLLAVEIPLLARSAGVAAAVRSREGRELVVGIAARVGVSTAAVFFWSMALPWLIQPVFTWSGLQQITPMASAATWVFWYILVAGALVIAAAASAWPRPYGLGLMVDPDELKRTERAPSMAREVARSFVVVVVVGVLLAGLISSGEELLLLAAGLLLAGPILTPVLPRITLPRAWVSAPGAVRFIAGMTVAIAFGWVILMASGDRQYESDFFVVLAVAVTAPILRILVEGGRAKGAVRADRPAGVSAGVIASLVTMTLVLWLGLPQTTSANNCPDAGEYMDCVKQGQLAQLGMIGGAIGGIGAAIYFRRWLRQIHEETKESKRWMFPPPPIGPSSGWRDKVNRMDRRRSRPPSEYLKKPSGPPPAPPSPPPVDRYPPNADSQNDAYNPGEAGPH